jgi:hypothetical protein
MFIFFVYKKSGGWGEKPPLALRENGALRSERKCKPERAAPHSEQR